MPERLFGTNGVRGVVNESLDCLTALRLGMAIGTSMGGRIAMASDTRGSADMIGNAVSAGIMAVGGDVVDLGVVPTPALQMFVRDRPEIAGGIMITASHNPPQFNGIKCISADGTEADRREESGIEALYAREMPQAQWDRVGGLSVHRGADEDYVDSIVGAVGADAIRAAGLTVCIDCANGAAFRTAPLLLRELGVRAVTLNCDAQGLFPGRPSEPSEENLGDLKALVAATGADLGVAHDGDADRCVFITRSGRYVSGDRSLALLSRYILSGTGGGSVVTPVSTSSMVQEVVEEAGGRLIRTAVGSPVVARRMMAENSVFGGEENGGLIFPGHQYCRDGAMAVAMMLECIVTDGPLDDQMDRLPVYHTEKRRIECPECMKPSMAGHLRGIAGDAVIDDTDGLRFDYPDGWILVRASGTEPLFRIYSESKDEKTARERADLFEQAVRERLALGEL